MAFLLALALWLFRVTGFLTEPMLTSDEIHAVAGEPSRTVWPLAPERPLRVVTWNIERGVKFEAVQSVLGELDADVVLLQEVDRFCSRSDDRDVARELAVQLRMNYVTAGEFQEIGEGRRDRPCVSGQAILSRLPITDATTVRFEDIRRRSNGGSTRRSLGAAAALRCGREPPVRCSYSVHLESGADEQRRANQVRDIVASVPPSDEPGDHRWRLQQRRRRGVGDVQRPARRGVHERDGPRRNRTRRREAADRLDFHEAVDRHVRSGACR